MYAVSFLMNANTPINNITMSIWTLKKYNAVTPTLPNRIIARLTLSQRGVNLSLSTYQTDSHLNPNQQITVVIKRQVRKQIL